MDNMVIYRARVLKICRDIKSGEQGLNTRKFYLFGKGRGRLRAILAGLIDLPPFRLAAPRISDTLNCEKSTRIQCATLPGFW